MKDLIVLVADKNMEFAVRGILQRTPSLKIFQTFKGTLQNWFPIKQINGFTGE